MKKLSKKELVAAIYEEGYVPWIRKGEIFEMDGSIWICKKSSERRFKAERLKKACR